MNTVNPGYIYTGMINEKTMGADGMKRLESLHPLGRLGKAEEIAHGLVFLVENEFPSGTRVVLEGRVMRQRDCPFVSPSPHVDLLK